MDIDEIAREMKETRKQGYGEYITVKGIKIRYFVKGSGSPVMLIHGFGWFLETWGFNIFPLSRRYQVFVIDLPGHGLSDKPWNGYTLALANECGYCPHIEKALEFNEAVMTFLEAS